MQNVVCSHQMMVIHYFRFWLIYYLIFYVHVHVHVMVALCPFVFKIK